MQMLLTPADFDINDVYTKLELYMEYNHQSNQIS